MENSGVVQRSAPARTLARIQIRVFRASSRQAASRHDEVAATDLRGAREERKPSGCFCSENAAKTKDPSGGTTGRVKLYRRLGWMGARAEYSLDGEGFPLPQI